MAILCISYVGLKCFPSARALCGNLYEIGALFSLEMFYLV